MPLHACAKVRKASQRGGQQLPGKPEGWFRVHAAHAARLDTHAHVLLEGMDTAHRAKAVERSTVKQHASSRFANLAL
eukprot:7803921-Lingulodinium_polyedra.AAC.1